MTLHEEWQPNADWPGYQFSNLGRVKSPFGRVLKPVFDSKDKYLFHSSMKHVSGKLRCPLVHRLIWEAFNGRIPSTLQVNHIDADKTNNCLSNLELMTLQENLAHARARGLHMHGARHYRAKLDDAQVRHIRQRLAAGESQHKIALELGMHQVTISQIHTRKTWKHIT